MRSSRILASAVASALAVVPVLGASAPFRQDSGAAGIVSMEAEQYHRMIARSGHDWQSDTTQSGYSGTATMQSLPDNLTSITTGYETSAPELRFDVEFVKTGTHYLWVRGYAISNGNTCHAGIDGVGTCTNIAFATNAWEWQKDSLSVSSAGVHIVSLWMREDGFRADKIVLTTDPGYTPTGTGPAESPQQWPATREGLVAHWRFEDYPGSGTVLTATDSTGNGYDGTLTSMPGDATNWVAGKTGDALHFDGVDDHVALPANVDIARNVGALTVAMWINVESLPASHSLIEMSRGDDTGLSRAWLQLTNSGEVNVGGRATDEATSSGLVTTNSPIGIGAWLHVTGVIDYANDTLAIYVDGQEKARNTSAGFLATSTPDTPSLVAAIGSEDDGTGNNYHGLIDDLRVYDRVLTPAEIEELAGGIDRGLVGHWRLDDGTGSTTAADSSGNGATGTLTGMAPATDWVAGRAGGALDFDGGNDYVDCGIPAVVGNIDEYTLCAWVRPNDTSTEATYGDPIIAKESTGTGFQFTWRFAGGVGQFGLMTSPAGNMLWGATDKVNGTWYHVAAVFDESTGEARIYVNGELDVSGARTYAKNAADPLCIASFEGARFLKATIDDVRIYGRVLSVAEIEQLAGGPERGLLAHWKLDETSGLTAADATGNGNDGTLTNMSGTEWTTGRISSGDGNTGALRFDGTNDYVLIAHDNAFLVDDGTMAFWFRADVTGTKQGLLSKDSSGLDTGGHVTISLDTAKNLIVRMQDLVTSYTVNSGTVDALQWHHVALAFGGGGMNLYLDGSSTTTNVYSGGLTNVGGGNREPMALGVSTAISGNLVATPTSDRYGGLLDDVRIYGRTLTAAEIRALYEMGLGTPFTPDDLGGLALWLDAADTDGDGDGSNDPADGAALGTWTDKSPGGRDAAQGASGSRPVYKTGIPNGRPVLRFDGTDDFMTFALPVNGLAGMTAFIVSSCARDSDGGASGVADAALFWNETTPSGWVCLSPFQTSVQTRFPGRHVAYTRPASIGTGFSITTAVKNGADVDLYVGGTRVAGDTGAADPIADCQDTGNVARGYDDDTYFAGDIAEILVYDRALSDLERESVEQYLRGKYLPAGDWVADRSCRIKITIDARKVAADQTDFPILFLLSQVDVAHDFWTIAQDGGGDLLVTKADGVTRLPLEVVSCDLVAKTGEIWFKGDLSSTSDTVFYLYYENATATQPAPSDPYGSEAVWTNGYVGVYHLNQDPSGGGGAIKDSTASPIDGTAYSMTSANLVGGKVGEALDFSGDAAPNADYVRLPSSGSDKLSITGDYMTLEAWVNRDGNTGGWACAIARQIGTSTGDSYGILLTDGAPDKFTLLAGENHNSNAGAVPNLTWTYIVGVRDGTEIRLYSDGTGVGTKTGVATPTPTDVNDTTIGAGENNATTDPSEPFRGMIDEARISNVARDAAYVETQHNMMADQTTFWKPLDDQEVVAGWRDAAWPWRIEIVIDSSRIPADQTGVPILFLLSNVESAHSFWTRAQDGGWDLLVTEADGVTRLPLEVVTCDTTAKTGEIWFKGDLSSTSDTVFYLYYGNPYPHSDGLVAHWRLDETSGISAADSSGNGHSGTLNNMDDTDWVSGLHGGALDLDGGNDYVAVSDADMLDATDKLTVAAWVYPTTLDGSARAIVSKRVNSTTGISYSLFFYTGNNLYVDIDMKDDQFSTNTVFSTGRWYHVAMVYDGILASTERVKVYVDGGLDITATETSAAIPNYASDLHLATLNAGYAEGLAGLLDDVRVYNRALTPTEIGDLAAGGHDVWSDGYAAVWHLHETSGIHADSTANANDATAQGGTVQDAAGKIDGADDFNLDLLHDDMLTVPHDPSLMITAEVTLEAWVRVTSFDETDQRVVQKKQTNNLAAYAMFVDNNIPGEVVFRVTDAANLYTVVNSTGTIAGDTVLSDMDTLTITFDMDTNQPPASTKAEIDGLIDFGAKSLGTDYTGVWTGAATLEITIQDATGGDLALSDAITVIADGTDDLTNAAGTSAASTAPGTVSGDWGRFVPAAPVIVSVVADDPDDGDTVLSDTDTLTIAFNVDTNQPAASTKAEIDGLIGFGAKSPGTDYTGVWNDARTLEITIQNSTGGDLAIGDTVTIIVDATDDLKNAAGGSAASAASGTVLGDWGTPAPAAPAIASAVADDPGSLDTWAYIACTYKDAANTVVIYIDGVTEGTNSTCTRVINPGNTEQVEIGGVETRGERGFRGTIDEVRISNVARGATYFKIQHEMQSDQGGFWKVPGGEHTLVPPQVVSVVADDPDDLDGVYGVGDTITITFDMDTNRSAIVTGLKTGTEMGALFTLSNSHTFGDDSDRFRLEWTSPSTLVITVEAASSANVNTGDTVTVLAAADIRDAGGTSLACTATSPAMTGDWGMGVPAAPAVASVVADDPDDGDTVLSDTDTLTITFNMDTNQPAASTKAEIDGLIDFGGKSLGTNYTGAWNDPRTLEITVVNATGGDLAIGDTITIIADGTNDLKDAAGTSPASTASGTVSGDWGTLGPTAPAIVSVAADDPDDGDTILSDMDTLTVTFNMDTNEPPASTKAEIDGLIGWSGKSLGADYTGVWNDARTLEITIQDAAGGDLAIGDTVTIVADGTDDLKDAAGTSPASTASGTVSGDWGIGPPGAFDLTAPADVSTGLGLTPTLEWGASQYAQDYELVVATDDAFTNKVIEELALPAIATSYAVLGGDLAPDTTYYWTVTAVNPLGSEPASSSYFSFTTTAAPVVQLAVPDMRPGPDVQVIGTVTLSATATDDVGVAQVEFLMDGAPIGVGQNTGGDVWQLSWNTVSVADGTYTITARATDDASVSADSEVSVSVENHVDWDGDGYTNIEEKRIGTDPLDAASHPDGGVGGGEGGCHVCRQTGAAGSAGAAVWALLAASLLAARCRGRSQVGVTLRRCACGATRRM